MLGCRRCALAVRTHEHWLRRLAHSSASFVDSAIVRITAGSGGDGCVAFAREKYIPYGPPSGGNGGDGGHVYIRASPGLRSLGRVPTRVRAQDGLHGKGQWQNGRKAGDRILEVPVGTVVSLLKRRMGQQPAAALQQADGDDTAASIDDSDTVSAEAFEPWQVRERAQALREQYEEELRQRARAYGEELPPDIAKKFEHIESISNRPQSKPTKFTRRQRSNKAAATAEARKGGQNDKDAEGEDEEPEEYLDPERLRLQEEAAYALAEEEALVRERRDTVWKQYPRGAIDARGEADESEDDAAYRLFQLAHAEQRLGLALLRSPAAVGGISPSNTATTRSSTRASSARRIPEGASAVPAGTTVVTTSSASASGSESGSATTEPIVWTADLSEPTPPDSPGLLVALGGLGGLGNPFFLTTVNRSPKYATKGSPGDDFFVHLELKTSADVGFVGFPNAGKSSLLQALTGAKGMGAEVGSWHFTTTSPNVGVMRVTGDGGLIGTGSGVISDTKEAEHLRATEAAEAASAGLAHPLSPNTDSNDGAVQDESFRLVLADIPGLLPGAGTHNVGLGHDFLRHIERCSSLIYVIDISPERAAPWDDLRSLRAELEAYLPGLSARGALVVANKADLLGRPVSKRRKLERAPVPGREREATASVTPVEDESGGSAVTTSEEDALAKLDRLREEVRAMYEEDIAAAEARQATHTGSDRASSRARNALSRAPQPRLMPVVPVSAKWRLNVDEVARHLRDGLTSRSYASAASPSFGARRTFSTSAPFQKERTPTLSTSATARPQSSVEKAKDGILDVDEDGIPTRPSWSVTELLARTATATSTSASDPRTPDLLTRTTLDKLHHLAALRPPRTERERDALRAVLEPMVRLAESVRAYEVDEAHYAAWTGESLDGDAAAGAAAHRADAVVVDARVAPRGAALAFDEAAERLDETPALREGEYDGTEEVPREVLLGMASRREGDFFVVPRRGAVAKGPKRE